KCSMNVTCKNPASRYRGRKSGSGLRKIVARSGRRFFKLSRGEMTISIPVLQNRTLLRLALMAAAILLAFWMDGLVADLFAKPIRSGQVRATLTNLRCWGEGPTLVMVAVG